MKFAWETRANSKRLSRSKFLIDFASVSVFFTLLQVTRAGPLTAGGYDELELMSLPGDTGSRANVDIGMHLERVSSLLDDLDTNIDHVRVRKRHHHPHHHRHRHHGRHNDGVDLNESEAANVTAASSHNDYDEMCRRGRISSGSEVTWKNGNCETCRCESRSVSCHRQSCPDLPCSSPVSVENECCPVCPEKICEAADGRKFNDGSKWHLDDCTFCECSKGRVLCSVEDCEFKSCSSPVKVPGQCCPVCPDSSCHGDNGSNHTTGTVWKEGECTHCYCGEGEKVCAQEKCPYINCSRPFRRPGDCCRRCSDAVECVVSDWGMWGNCPIQECGGGMRRRYRSVVIAPRNGGSFCPHMSEAQMCPRLSCNELPVCPVTAWGAWSHCTATCGAGRKLRTRKKTKVTKATMTSLIDCATTHMQESMRCYAGTCNLHLRHEPPAPDPDHCFSTVWSEWGACSTACGKGTQTREQRLLNASHPDGHLCHLLRETRQCHGHNCTGTPNNPIHCKVTHWGPWTPCSATCGATAAKSKHRSVQRHPSPGGRPCPRLFMTRSCRLPPCDILQLTAANSDDRCVSDDGLRHYAENERWDPVECISCVCINSKKICEPSVCPEPECSDPTPLPGFCCPFCFPGMP